MLKTECFPDDIHKPVLHEGLKPAVPEDGRSPPVSPLTGSEEGLARQQRGKLSPVGDAEQGSGVEEAETGPPGTAAVPRGSGLDDGDGAVSEGLVQTVTLTVLTDGTEHKVTVLEGPQVILSRGDGLLVQPATTQHG